MIKELELSPNDCVKHFVVQCDRRGHAHHEEVDRSDEGKEEYTENHPSKDVHSSISVDIFKKSPLMFSDFSTVRNIRF